MVKKTKREQGDGKRFQRFSEHEKVSTRDAGRTATKVSTPLPADLLGDKKTTKSAKKGKKAH